MYDPNDPRRFRSDFQAELGPPPQMPAWIPMGDDQSQDIGQNVASIGGAFKERFMGGSQAAPDSNVHELGHSNENAQPLQPVGSPIDDPGGPMMKRRGDPELMKPKPGGAEGFKSL